jgi:hypothetical protein
LGAYFAILRPAFLPEDLRFLGPLDTEAIRSASRLALWPKNVFIVLGGFMAGSGTLVLVAVTDRGPLRRIGLGLAGALTLTLMAAVNCSTYRKLTSYIRNYQDFLPFFVHHPADSSNLFTI